LWNLNTGDCLKTVSFNTSPICLSEMDNQHFLCGFNNGTIELFDINEFESIKSINAFPHRVMNIKSLLKMKFLAFLFLINYVYHVLTCLHYH
jgi:WD40 repeat protein